MALAGYITWEDENGILLKWEQGFHYKGALYFENKFEYVSDQLIYPKQKIK